MENAEQNFRPQSKQQRKQARKELIRNYKPSAEQIKRQNLIDEELNFRKVVTEDWDDFHAF